MMLQGTSFSTDLVIRKKCAFPSNRFLLLTDTGLGLLMAGFLLPNSQSLICGLLPGCARGFRVFLFITFVTCLFYFLNFIFLIYFKLKFLAVLKIYKPLIK